MCTALILFYFYALIHFIYTLGINETLLVLATTRSYYIGDPDVISRNTQLAHQASSQPTPPSGMERQTRQK